MKLVENSYKEKSNAQLQINGAETTKMLPSPRLFVRASLYVL